VVGLTLLCHRLLVSAAAGGAIGSGQVPLYVAAGCFLFAAGAVVGSSRCASPSASPGRSIA